MSYKQFVFDKDSISLNGYFFKSTENFAVSWDLYEIQIIKPLRREEKTRNLYELKVSMIETDGLPPGPKVPATDVQMMLINDEKVWKMKSLLD